MPWVIRATDFKTWIGMGWKRSSWLRCKRRGKKLSQSSQLREMKILKRNLVNNHVKKSLMVMQKRIKSIAEGTKNKLIILWADSCRLTMHTQQTMRIMLEVMVLSMQIVKWTIWTQIVSWAIFKAIMFQNNSRRVEISTVADHNWVMISRSHLLTKARTKARTRAKTKA